MKIDITSKVLEQSVEAASGFLKDLLSPAVKESGELLKDIVSGWRFKNQVRILNKTKAYCAKHSISPKAMSLKLLLPYLESAGLEEDEGLQDKWAIMLGNMLDPEQSLENNIFPFILSQISRKEFEASSETLIDVDMKVGKLKSELKILQAEPNTTLFSPVRRKIEDKLGEVNRAEYLLPLEKKLETYEIANLVRCGIVSAIPVQYGHSRGVEVKEDESGMHTTPIEIEIDHVEDQYVFTPLGRLFFKVCSEKSGKG